MTVPAVVGVDGSACSLDAVDLAAREAVLRNRPLYVVYAFFWPFLGVPLGPSPLGPPEGGLLGDTQRIVQEAVDRARQAEPSVAVTGAAITGAAAEVLIDQSKAAAVVVGGDRGLGGFTGLLVGSVAVQLAAHAACPVLVARGRPNPTGDVLVGVDESPAGEPAIGFAFEEAALRGARLTALHAWTHPQAEAEEARVLAEALAGWRDKYPDLVVRRELRHAHVRPALIDETKRSQLVVVGSRGRGGFSGLLLGSVSQAVLHHAHCPVMIIPHVWQLSE